MAITKESLRIRMGLNIRRERIAVDMSIEELAHLLDLTPGFLGLIERGQRGITAPNMYKIAEVFNMPIDALFADGQQEYQKMPKTDILQKKIAGLIADLPEQYLDFIIESIHGIRKLSVHKGRGNQFS